jgi:hypothetical protein
MANSRNRAIAKRVFLIRQQRVMLDEDLALLYGVRVKAFNQAVRRNLRRFPPEFMFQLTSVEFHNMRSQIVTASRRNIRHRPLAFTEHGIAMLSSVLRSEQAIQVNIAIIKAFIQLRHALSQHKELAVQVERLEGKINLLETDVRLVSKQIRALNQLGEKTGPTVKGFVASDD